MSKNALSSPVSRRSFLRATGYVAAASTLAGAAGCTRGLTKSSNDAVSFMFWGEGDQTKRMLASIETFEKKSHIHIRPQYSGLNGYYDKLATSVAGGNPPDMFQIHLPMLSEYRRRDVPRKLNQYVPDSLPLDRIPDTVVETCRFDGDYYYYYYVPTGVAVQPVVVYDKTALTRLRLDPPGEDWTFDQFRRLAGRVVRASSGKLYGTADMGASPQAFESYLRGRKKALFTDAGELGFERADLTSWLDIWRGMRADHSCVPMTVTAVAKGFDTNPMIKGKAVFTSAATSRGLQAYQALTKHTVELLPHPKPHSGSSQGANIIPAGWFAVARRSARSGDCVKYLRFLLSDPDAIRVVGLSRGVPIMRELRKAVYKGLDPLEKRIYDNVELVDSRRPAPVKPYPPGAGELLDTSLTDANEDVGFGKATAAKAADRFFQDAERILK